MSTPQDPQEPQEPQEPPAPDPPAEPSEPTEPTEPAEPAEPAAASGPRRLTRSSSDRVLGGVAGGLGRYFGVDPLLFRVAFFVLTLAGGAGILAYAALWLFVPNDAPGAEAPAAGRQGAVLLAAIGLLIALVLVSGGFLPFLFGPGLFFAALAGLVAAAALSGTRGGTGAGRVLAVVGSVAAAVAAVVVGAFVTAAGGGVATAALLVVAGVALVAAAFSGGGRWLILPALALAAPTAFVAAADIDATGGIGERSYRPASVATIDDRYELGIGELHIDLRDVEFPPGEHVVDVDLGMGEVRVLVPEEVCAALEADIGAGWAQLYGTGAGGLDVEMAEHPERPAAVPRVTVNADVGLGQVVVHTFDDDLHPFDDDGPPNPWHRRDGRFGTGSGACA